MIWICFAPPRLEQLAAIKSTVNSCVSQSIVDLNRSFLPQLKLGMKQVYNRKAEKEMTQGAAIIP